MDRSKLTTTAVALTAATVLAGCGGGEKPQVEGRVEYATTVSTEDGRRTLGKGVLVAVDCQENKPDGTGRALGGVVLDGANAGDEFTGLDRSAFNPSPNDPFGADEQTPPQDPTGPLDRC